MFRIFALLLGFGSAALAAESAFSALTALPAEDRARLARIEGPEGNLEPDRWYFAVYATDSASGLREYVVADHRIVARREISQFATSLTPQDIVDGRFTRTDSSDVEQLAKAFAAANNQVIATLSLTMAKPSREGRPIWMARCFNSSGAVFGYLVVAAENGTIFSHEGFAYEPNRSSSEIANDGHVRRHRSPAPRLVLGTTPPGTPTGFFSRRVPSVPNPVYPRPAPAGRPWWLAQTH